LKTQKRTLAVIAVLASSIILSMPFDVGASSQPQPLPAGMNCTEAARQAAIFRLYVSGAISNFSMTLQAEKGNITYSMNGLSYDSSLGYFRIDSLHLRIANTTTNKLLAEGTAKGVLLDTHSNSTYVVFQFVISSLTWNADAKFMQKFASDFPLTSLSVQYLTLKLGVNCADNTYTVGGSQQTNIASLIARVMKA
jgi:hypothetical protein